MAIAASQHATCISVSSLQTAVAAPRAPIVIDVRRTAAFSEATAMIRGALRRQPDDVDAWASALPTAEAFVVYCAHGHEVSQQVARVLAERGLAAGYLERGIAAWLAAGGAWDRKPKGASTRWVTRERPKIDRIACPWLLARFVDADAEFLYVPTADVLRTAATRDAIPYDIPDVHFSHVDEQCSFDAFVRHYRLHDPAMARLATIVRGADTARLGLAPEAAGLAALSLGLSRNCRDDHAMLAHGMVMYDALYSWCKDGQDERHSWNPTAGARVAA